MKLIVDKIALGLLLVSIFAAVACNRQWKGQDPLKVVDTHAQPIQKQLREVFSLGNGYYASNDFDCARLSGIVLTNDTLITALINPENTPINASPWYAFKIWSDTVQSIYLKLSYLHNVKHRYPPKISMDGKHWNLLDSALVIPGPIAKRRNDRQQPDFITMRLKLSKDTMWIAANEIVTSSETELWSDRMATIPFVEKSNIGESRDGRPINILTIGEADDSKLLMLLGRQHPPEISGYWAMKKFVETICTDNKLARQFRNRFRTYVVPMVNPDGIDNGHWRHTTGGVDPNRDWAEFRQKETSLIRNFMIDKESSSAGVFLCGIDFHSTVEDIYYTIDPKLKGNMPGLIPQLIDSIAKAFPDHEHMVRAKDEDDYRISSVSYFFHGHGAEALVYEVGDEAPKDFVLKKAEVAANTLMEIMLSRDDSSLQQETVQHLQK
jgi:cytosolic carboxypeptidase protein 6